MSRTPITTPEGDVLSPKLTYRVVLLDEYGLVSNSLAVADKLPSRRHGEQEIARLESKFPEWEGRLEVVSNVGRLHFEVIDE